MLKMEREKIGFGMEDEDEKVSKESAFQRRE